jgi:hypothetical protein
MVVKLVAVLLVVVMLVRVPVVAYATVVDTDTGRFVLTSSGVAKVEAAFGKVSRGLAVMEALGKLVGPVAVGFALFEIGSTIWDWWHRDYNPGVSGVLLDAPAGVWGVQSPGGSVYQAVAWIYRGPGCSQPDGWVWTNNFGGSPGVLSGGQLLGVTTQDISSGSCKSVNVIWTVAQTVAPAGTVGTVGSTASTQPQTREATIAAIDSAIAELTAAGTATNPVLGGVMPATSSGLANAIDALQQARQVLSDGVQLMPGTDVSPGVNHSTSPGTAPAPVPSSGSGGSTQPDMTATNTKLDEIKGQLTATPSSAPATVCPECTRSEKWGEWWDTLRAAGQAAPIFMLLNNLVINPSGSVLRTNSAGTSRWGTLVFDLTPWGIDTWIGVLRYCVLFSAMLGAYFVIFG